MAVAVGVGARSSASGDDLRAAVGAALRAAGLTPADVAALATLDRRGADATVRDLASGHGWRLALFTAAELSARAVPTPSSAVTAAVGTPSVAEAAALCAAGPDGVLLLPKRVFPSVTVAIAATPGLAVQPAPAAH
ncbi:cobalamin biosynthesis protein [Paractinoplanes lichenicola]|uniref:Cobalamin biosynthesis protein n=1 Tax=Paractinoplanes lichenicola TaxID=2802976 RepID=A0ABS1VX89_9ACTN|nr:cobalamin biosynthesis protein [Actinoplanes lichenicola]MBL7259111.1 cobalamin biosynthesis protein [Actinoplanes lichenicola]